MIHYKHNKTSIQIIHKITNIEIVDPTSTSFYFNSDGTGLKTIGKGIPLATESMHSISGMISGFLDSGVGKVPWGYKFHGSITRNISGDLVIDYMQLIQSIGVTVGIFAITAPLIYFEANALSDSEYFISLIPSGSELTLYDGMFLSANLYLDITASKA